MCVQTFDHRPMGRTLQPWWLWNCPVLQIVGRVRHHSLFQAGRWKEPRKILHSERTCQFLRSAHILTLQDMTCGLLWHAVYFYMRSTLTYGRHFATDSLHLTHFGALRSSSIIYLIWGVGRLGVMGGVPGNRCANFGLEKGVYWQKRLPVEGSAIWSLDWFGDCCVIGVISFMCHWCHVIEPQIGITSFMPQIVAIDRVCTLLW